MATIGGFGGIITLFRLFCSSNQISLLFLNSHFLSNGRISKFTQTLKILLTRRLAQGRCAKRVSLRHHVRFLLSLLILADPFPYWGLEWMRPWTHVRILPDCAQCQLQFLQLFLISCRFTVSFPEAGPVCARAELGHHARTLELLRC